LRHRLALRQRTQQVHQQQTTRRVHHVGTKLNQAELHELEALAAKRKQTQGELIRGLVLREIEQDKTGLRPSAEMVEITIQVGKLWRFRASDLEIWLRAKKAG
jgi:hypothetical protein